MLEIGQSGAIRLVGLLALFELLLLKERSDGVLQRSLRGCAVCSIAAVAILLIGSDRDSMVGRIEFGLLARPLECRILPVLTKPTLFLTSFLPSYQLM